MQIDLNSLPDQKYFTMGEASEILSVKDHVLRYLEKNPVSVAGGGAPPPITLVELRIVGREEELGPLS